LWSQPALAATFWDALSKLATLDLAFEDEIRIIESFKSAGPLQCMGRE